GAAAHFLSQHGGPLLAEWRGLWIGAAESASGRGNVPGPQGEIARTRTWQRGYFGDVLRSAPPVDGASPDAFLAAQLALGSFSPVAAAEDVMASQETGKQRATRIP